MEDRCLYEIRISSVTCRNGALTDTPPTQQVGKDLAVRIAFGKLPL